MSDQHRSRFGMACLVTAFGLSACAHKPTPISAYVPQPVTASSPRLLMRAQLQPDEAYGVQLYAGAEDCTQPKQVGVARAGRDVASTTLVEEHLSTLQVVVVKPNRGVCLVRWSFVPKASHAYLVVTRSQPGRCSVSLMDATNPDAIVPEPSARRRDAGTSLCIPLSQTQAVSDPGHSVDGGPGLPVPAVGSKPGTVSEDDLKGLIGK